jgi:hypothetical protein
MGTMHSAVVVPNVRGPDRRHPIRRRLGLEGRQERRVSRPLEFEDHLSAAIQLTETRGI